MASKFETYGAITVGSQFLAANVSSTVVQLISPALNVSGVLVKTLNAAVTGGASTVSSVNIFADTAAPSSAGDFTKRIAFAAQVGPNAASSTPLPNALFLPAGVGLWAGSSGTAAVSMSYDVLPADFVG